MHYGNIPHQRGLTQMPVDPFALWLASHPGFSIVGHDSDDDDEDLDEDDVEDDASDEDDDDDDSDDDEDGSDEDDESPEALKKKLKDADRARVKAERALAKAQRNQAEPDDDDDDDDASEEVKSLREENAAFRKLVNGPYIQSQINSFVDDDGNPRWDWEDPEVVYALLKRSELEVDPETGEVDGLEEQLEDLAERKPHLLKVAENEIRVRRSSGKAPGGRSKSKKDPNAKSEAELRKIFPAAFSN